MFNNKILSALDSPVIIKLTHWKYHLSIWCSKLEYVRAWKCQEKKNCRRYKTKSAWRCDIRYTKGIATGHYVHFITDTLDTMDGSLNMKNFHIVMDNAPVHSLEAIDPIILEKGYIYLYAYSHIHLKSNPLRRWKLLLQR